MLFYENPFNCAFDTVMHASVVRLTAFQSNVTFVASKVKSISGILHSYRHARQWPHSLPLGQLWPSGSRFRNCKLTITACIKAFILDTRWVWMQTNNCIFVTAVSLSVSNTHYKECFNCPVPFILLSYFHAAANLPMGVTKWWKFQWGQYSQFKKVPRPKCSNRAKA